MGCDIHSYAERCVGNKYFALPAFEPFEVRSYSTYAFLAGVRNYSGIVPITAPRGIPIDASIDVMTANDEWGMNAHTPSWLSVSELEAFNYDVEMEDRRYMKQTGPNSFTGAATCEPGQGKRMTWREFLGDEFFEDLRKLKLLGADRIVFWFDN